jgi:hypothetical protein
LRGRGRRILRLRPDWTLQKKQNGRKEGKEEEGGRERGREGGREEVKV